MSQDIRSNIYGVELGDRTRVKLMGVLNLSQESFYKDSYISPSDLIATASRMIQDGASFLDIGARSTAPHTTPISIEEEKNRIRENLGALLQNLNVVGPDVIISVDTQYAEVMEVASDLGDQYGFNRFLLNDVSGLVTDKENLSNFLRSHPMPIIIMPGMERPGDIYLLEDLMIHLNDKVSMLHDLGITTRDIILDPGIGKWVEYKKASDDLALINNISHLRSFGAPILVAISRKSFIGSICNIPDPRDRFAGTLAATAIAVYNGAHVVRTHDVNKETWDVIRIAESARAELKK